MFFVILNHPNGGVVPLVENEGGVATFETAEAAQAAISGNLLGIAYGGKVFDTDQPFTEG